MPTKTGIANVHRNILCSKKKKSENNLNTQFHIEVYYNGILWCSESRLASYML